MVRNKLTVRTIVVTLENGLRIERDWDSIPEEEQQIISRNITDRFMKAAGYMRADEYDGQMQQDKAPPSSLIHGQEDSIAFNAREAAAYLKIHYETLLKMSRKKQIPHYRIGRKLLFRKDVLDQWIQEQEQGR